MLCPGAYDGNGNLKSDSYKGISSITYNHLNLPKLITFSSGNTIEIIYDASGNKLRKIVKQGATVQYEQDYSGGIEYRKTPAAGTFRIEAIYHEEGRYFNLNVDASNTPSWRKEYALRDHLGNTRLLFADKDGDGMVEVTSNAATNEIIQENHYYPFGLSYGGSHWMNDAARDNGYKYNGKELNEDWGLGWYDYGARWYMPDLGRWGAVDPLATTYSSWSSYHYAMNNPIRFTDVLGMGAGDFYDEGGKYLGTDGKDDERLYVVTDKQEKIQIQKTDKAGGTTPLSNVSSATELPSAYVRGEMGKAVDRAGSPSFHEEGGFFGTKKEGGEYVVHAKAGEKADPSIDKEASINVYIAANKDDLNATSGGEIKGTFHTHPDGVVTKGATGSNTIGGTTITHRFVDEPSNLNGRGDIPNARENAMGVTGNSYVLAQGNKTVYIYNGSGTVARFPFKQFFSIGIKK
ncbi:MAG: RHS repeat-associated core domain-containing protein [Haliscomenobacter sp.]|nr:RHS repeat-associated core domain-containing protein [Haliscomenobacter sp.]